jgi:alginate O-acetyltransferase complex protein AlgI
VLIAEKACLLKLLERSPRALGHIYALSLVFIGWVIFALDKSSALSLTALLGGGADGLWSGALAYELCRYAPSLIIMAVGCTPLPRRLYLKIKERFAPIDIILPLAGLVLSVAYIAGAGYGPFLYFRF